MTRTRPIACTIPGRIGDIIGFSDYYFEEERVLWTRALSTSAVGMTVDDGESPPGRLTPLAFVNESRLYFFFVRKPKNSTEKKSVRKKCLKKHSGKVLVPPEKFPDCFQTSDSHISPGASQVCYYVYSSSAGQLDSRVEWF
jgi:hypothetical protein